MQALHSARMGYGDCCGKLYHEERWPSQHTMNQPAQQPIDEFRRGMTPFVMFPCAQSTNRAAESALGIIVRAMQASAAINGAAIDAASGSARLPRNGFKKKKRRTWTLALNYRKTMSGCRVNIFSYVEAYLVLQNQCFTVHYEGGCHYVVPSKLNFEMTLRGPDVQNLNFCIVFDAKVANCHIRTSHGKEGYRIEFSSNFLGYKINISFFTIFHTDVSYGRTKAFPHRKRVSLSHQSQPTN
jgi:hypothetical protein